MTILEDIKKGRLVVVPREATAEMLDVYWRYSGESKEMRERVHSRARIRYADLLTASPDHTAGLIALVEGMERERDSICEKAVEKTLALDAAEARALAAEAERDEADAEITSTESLLADERRMRFAAEAERDALREALAEAVEFADQDAQALTAAGIALIGRWRALTEKNNG